VQGQPYKPYREELDVAPGSMTETYVAMKLTIDNWRWHGMPFYLRTGKRMPRKLSQVVVTFNPVPHLMFPESSYEEMEPNRLIINIQPDEGISVRLQAKEPGSRMRLRTVNMDFTYEEAFHQQSREAYETLLQEVIEGSTTLFMRADQDRLSWELFQPLIDAYDVYQHLMDYWAATMQDDAYLIAADGWVAQPSRVMEIDKKGRAKDKGWVCELIPKALVVARYFAAEQAALDALQAELDAAQASQTEMEEEQSG
jgi:glucose-6-phosphate 1-dehydrogenase